jgi:hypothetical protein
MIGNHMSFSGKYTPSQLTFLSEIISDRGISANKQMVELCGSWDGNNYSYGSLLNDTHLYKINDFRKLLLASIKSSSTGISWDTYRRTVNLGLSTIPALCNTHPATFIPTYAGNNSWISGNPVADGYPPKNYPDTQYSYIHQSTGNYAWLGGWPIINGWQNSDDTYAAFFKPAIGDNETDWDNWFSDGFTGLLSKQSYYELGGDFNSLNSFVRRFQTSSNFKESRNKLISSLINSKSFGSGIVSKQDLISGDLSSVNTLFKHFGGDLINLGRVLDISNMSKFGYPSALLKIIYDNNCLTDDLKYKLLLQHDVSIYEFNNILDGRITSLNTEAKLYNCFKDVDSEMLYDREKGILYGLNCNIPGLENLAELLNVKKIFPNSYAGFTVPRYDIYSNESKILENIYINGQLNEKFNSIDTLLKSVLPGTLGAEAEMLSICINQIKNINSLSTEKFAQVVKNIELPKVIYSSTGNSMVDVPEINKTVSKLSFGSGPHGLYEMSDFFGACSGIKYVEKIEKCKSLINRITSDNLLNLIDSLMSIDLTLVSAETTLNNHLDLIELELSNIKNSNILSVELNELWESMGSQLSIEQRATTLAVPVSGVLSQSNSDEDFINFVSGLESYALSDGPNNEFDVLRKLADHTNGGLALESALIEARNAMLLNLSGSTTTNDISPSVSPYLPSATAVIDSTGKIVDVVITHEGYVSDVKGLTVFPFSKSTELQVKKCGDTGKPNSILVTNSDDSFAHVEIEFIEDLSDITQISYADSPYKNLVPKNLTIF